MERLYETMHRLLENTTSNFLRYAYSDIDWNNRMLGLVGPRGVGKTTLFLQHLKCQEDIDNCLFVSADDIYFSDHTLLDTAEELYKNGCTSFYIDEIHKYSNWSQELKSIYDRFPGLHVYFTGSSILDIEKGEADLSRRAPKYLMQGLSFREFLAMRYEIHAQTYALDEIIHNEAEIPGLDHPLPVFREYLREGYYPFGQDPDFQIELLQVINRTLEVDIPQFANMTAATGKKLKKLLMLISAMVPFKPNMTKLAAQIQASRNNLEDYLLYVEKAGLIAQLREQSGKLSSFGKTEKVYLDNTNLIYALSEGSEDVGTIRETFFLNQMRVKNRVSASAISDFEVDGITFEVGGKSKSFEQLKDADRGFVVKDDIEYGHGNVVPLWAFGLNY